MFCPASHFCLTGNFCLAGSPFFLTLLFRFLHQASLSFCIIFGMLRRMLGGLFFLCMPRCRPLLLLPGSGFPALHTLPYGLRRGIFPHLYALALIFFYFFTAGNPGHLMVKLFFIIILPFNGMAFHQHLHHFFGKIFISRWNMAGAVFFPISIIWFVAHG